jgi:hypothetical protein
MRRMRCRESALQTINGVPLVMTLGTFPFDGSGKKLARSGCAEAVAANANTPTMVSTNALIVRRTLNLHA